MNANTAQRPDKVQGGRRQADNRGRLRRMGFWHGHPSGDGAGGGWLEVTQVVFLGQGKKCRLKAS